MTEYGRGQGSQPWHPEDPLYGDQDWDNAQRQADQDPYDTQHQAASQPYQDPQGYAYGTWQQGDQQQGAYGGAAYDPYQQAYQPPEYGQGQSAGYEYGGYGDTGQQAAYGAQDPHPTYGQQHQGGGTDPYQGAPYQGHGAQDPYGHGVGHYDEGRAGPGPYNQADPYNQAGPYGQTDPYGQPDPYAPADTYPPQHAERPTPPEPTSGQPGRPGQAGAQRSEVGPDPETGWDPGSELDDHAFFADDSKPELVDTRARRNRDSRRKPDDSAGRDPDEADGADHDDSDDDAKRGGTGGRRGGGRREGGRSRKGTSRRKGGVPSMVMAAVLVAGVGGAGYGAYQYFQGSSAPDYAGDGSGEVQVEIPANSSLSQIGNILKKEGVVKSHDAFVAASNENEQAGKIHAGSYILRKEMSAVAAIEMMLDPASQGGLIVPEGLRASKIYELIDEKTSSPKGTTERAAQDGDFDLPSWAEDGEDPLEGFLFPSKYGVSKNTKPEAVLKEMVKRAKSEFKKVDLEANAKKVDRTPYEVLTIASLIQAEAQSDEEFGKVSRVVYNRLKPGNSATNGRLDFDSTINYALGRSTLDVSVGDTKLEHPYNTYRVAGLPPGPIDNPGHQAIESALKPTKGEWLYFVTVRAGDTRFSETFEEHTRHVREFNEEQRKKGGD